MLQNLPFGWGTSFITDDELRRIIQDEVFRPEISVGSLAEDAAQSVAIADARMKAEKKSKK